MIEEARREHPDPDRDRMEAKAMVVVYGGIACALGACRFVVPIANRVFRSADNNAAVPSTMNAQSVVADAAERIAPLAGRRGLGEATASRTGGVKFFNPRTGDSIRIEPGNPNANFASGRQPYVKESFGGTVRDANGNSIPPTQEFPNPGSNPAAHIPAEAYLKRQGI